MAKFKIQNYFKKFHLVFIGPPGCGKGTQIELLQKKFNLILIPSPGNIYRDPKFRKTKLGQIIAPLVDQGKFAPDKITNQIMKKKILDLTKAKKGFVSEGYPRTLPQAKFADKYIGIDYLINLNVPEKIIMKRLAGRRVCPKCQTNYHLNFKPPQKPGLCDKCKIPLIQRDDDKPESIKIRLKVYKKTAEPTIKYYRKQGKIIDTNGNQTIKKIQQKIVKKLSSLFPLRSLK